MAYKKLKPIGKCLFITKHVLAIVIPILLVIPLVLIIYPEIGQSFVVSSPPSSSSEYPLPKGFTGLTLNMRSGSTTIGAWVFVPPKLVTNKKNKSEEYVLGVAVKAAAVIIYCHGIKNDRAHETSIESYRKLVEGGFVVVALDYTGFGDSAGTVNGDAAAEDVQSIHKWVKIRFNKGVKILLYGFGGGTGIAARAYAGLMDKRASLCAIVLECSYTTSEANFKETSFYKWVLSWMPMGDSIVKKSLNAAKMNFNLVKDLTGLKKREILLIHAEDDEENSFDEGYNLYDALKKARAMVKFVWFANCYHMGHYPLNNDEAKVIPAIIWNMTFPAEASVKRPPVRPWRSLISDGRMFNSFDSKNGTSWLSQGWILWKETDYWPATVTQLVKNNVDSNSSNDVNAKIIRDKMNQLVQAESTTDEFYIIVVNSASGYALHVDDDSRMVCEGFGNLRLACIYPSKRISFTNSSEMNEFEDAKNAQKHSSIRCSGSKDLQESAEQIKNQIAHTGMVAIIGANDVAIRSTGKRSSGPGWWITVNCTDSESKTKPFKIIVGYE